MIIYGTRGIKSTIKEGTFHCPQCEQSKEYRHRKVTKFFTLYFIPLIPLGSAGEYVECRNCKNTYIPRVLDNQASNGNDVFMANYEKAIRHSMVLMMLADGVIDEEEKEIVLKIINKFGTNDITMTQLVNYIDIVQKENETIDTYLKKVGPSLNEHGKEIIIKCAFSVAAADGNVDKSELRMIAIMADAMQMSKSHLNGILADLSGSN